MLIQVHRVDKDGFYVEPCLITNSIEEKEAEQDKYIIEVDPSEGLYKPRWLNGEWVEGLTPEEIEEIKKTIPQEPSKIDILGQQLAEKEVQILQLQADNEKMGQSIVNLELKLMNMEGK